MSVIRITGVGTRVLVINQAIPNHEHIESDSNFLHRLRWRHWLTGTVIDHDRQQSRRGFGTIPTALPSSPIQLPSFEIRHPLGVGSGKDIPSRLANHICRIRQSVTRNVSMLRSYEFSTKDFAGAMRSERSVVG